MYIHSLQILESKIWSDLFYYLPKHLINGFEWMNAQVKMLVHFKRNCDQLYTPKMEGELEGTHSWVQLPSWCWRAKQSCKMTCWFLKCSFTRKVNPLTKWNVLEWTYYMARGEQTPNLVIQITWASRDDPPTPDLWGGGWFIDLIFKGEKGW